MKCLENRGEVQRQTLIGPVGVSGKNTGRIEWQGHGKRAWDFVSTLLC